MNPNGIRVRTSKDLQDSGSSAAAIGRFVRERRRARGWTQEQLADYAGVGKRFVVELERGKPTVQLDAVDRVVRMFGKRVALGDLDV